MMSMSRNQLGTSDIQVSPICLGCWQFNGGKSDETWPAQPEEVSKAIVDKAIEMGVNFFDTAEAYGLHGSEAVVGRCLAGRRKDVVIGTKYGLHKGRTVMQYSATDIEKSLTESLQALQTDYVDLYQVHWSVNMKDAAETVMELKRQKSLGRIREYGFCNFGEQDVKDFCAVGGEPCTNQLPYNLIWRPIEFKILDACKERNISVLAYSPLQQGLLSGRFHQPSDVPEGRRRSRHFSKDSTSLSRHGQVGAETETFKTIGAIRELCKQADIPMSSAALSWVLAQDSVASVIVGCRTPEQLEANCKLVQLSQEIQNKLSECSEELKNIFGPNPDMWAETSRYH